jgi:pimeloyl-ACP methyl ester carboxylesterase
MSTTVRLSRRKALLAAAATGSMLQACATVPVAGSRPRHYVLVHGAWHGAWTWIKTVPLLRQAGHTASAPTLSGLGERAHVGAGSSGLAVHVQDIEAHLRMEDLHDVVLVGHSYAGCVVSGVLAARTGRVAHAVYVDAFVPLQGQSMADYLPAPVRASFHAAAAKSATEPPPPVATWGERWGLTDPALVQWASARMTPQAALSFVEKVHGDPMADDSIRRSYLKCARNPNPGFRAIAAAVQKNPRFRYAEVDGHHNIMLVDPKRFVDALVALG